MKKVLFFSWGEFAPYKGGIASYAKSLAKTLSGHAKVSVVGPFMKTADTESEFKVIRPRIGRWPLARLAIGNLYSLFIYLVKNPDHVFITDQISLSLVKLLLPFKRESTKIHYFVYGTEIEDVYSGTGHVKREDFEKMLNKFDSVTAISEYVKKSFEGKFKNVTVPVTLLNPTVDSEFIDLKVNDKETESVLKKYRLKKGGYILSVGRLYKRKGHHTVSVPKDIKYVVAGTGPEHESLSKKQNIVLTGEIDDKTKKILMQNCLFYVHPSIKAPEVHQRVEGFGISIIEAFALGKTAVVFSHGGMTEIVKDNVNGLVVKENDEDALTAAIKRLASDTDLRVRLEKRASTDFESKYSMKIFAEKAGEALEMKGIISSKPNVVFVVEWFYPVVGGAGKQALLQAKHLKNRYRIKIATRMVGKSGKEETVSGIQVQRFGIKGNSRFADYLSGISLFFHLVKNGNAIDVVHVHGNLENNFPFFAILFSKIFNVPVVGKLAIAGELKSHLESERYSTFSKILKAINPFNFIRRSLVRHLDQYIAISRSIMTELEETIGDNEKIAFIPNGIDVKPGKLSRKDSEMITFLVVSRLASHKGIIDPLLEVWRKRFKDDKKVKLQIVGSGESLSSSIENEVHEFVEKNKLENVSLVGKKDNVESYYSKANVFILPSENEGLSNALLEAASYGLVCIVSDTSGNTDIVREGINGYVFVKRNGKDLESKINQAIKDKDKWSEFGMKIKDRVESGYSISAVADSLSALYKKLLNGL